MKREAIVRTIQGPEIQETKDQMIVEERIKLHNQT